MEVFEYCLHHLEIGRLIHRPALGGQIDGVSQRERSKSPGLPNVRCHVLALRRARRLSPRTFESIEGKHLNIQSIGISRRIAVAGIVDTGRLECRNRTIHELRVDQRAIAGNAHHDVCARMNCGLIVPIQDVLLTTAIHLVIQTSDVPNQRFVARVVRGGDDDMIDLGGLAQSPEEQLDERNPQNGFHHLAGKASGAHARLNDGHRLHVNFQREGSRRSGSSL